MVTKKVNFKFYMFCACMIDGIGHQIGGSNIVAPKYQWIGDRDAKFSNEGS